jgi:hypothetical protein
MPTEMTEDELRRYGTRAEAMETYDYRNPADEDDYISAVLYRLYDGRHFRVVSSSGRHSSLAGVGKIGEWLPTNEEVQSWKKF